MALRLAHASSPNKPGLVKLHKFIHNMFICYIVVPSCLGSACSHADVLKFPRTKMGGAESCNSVHPFFIVGARVLPFTCKMSNVSVFVYNLLAWTCWVAHQVPCYLSFVLLNRLELLFKKSSSESHFIVCFWVLKHLAGILSLFY